MFKPNISQIDNSVWDANLAAVQNSGLSADGETYVSSEARDAFKDVRVLERAVQKVGANRLHALLPTIRATVNGAVIAKIPGHTVKLTCKDGKVVSISR